MKKRESNLLVGIDEAGRGPLAGPVAVGACCYDLSDKALMKALRQRFPAVKDSKQLSEARREEVFKELTALSRTTTLRFHVALVPARTIDVHGVSHAIRKGIERALKALHTDPATTHVLLDGGLRAPAAFITQKTFVRGDALHLPIALASIVAKVTRDRHMVRLSKRFPAHKFEIHKGYGTKNHYQLLKRYGRTAIHRTSFL